MTAPRVESVAEVPDAATYREHLAPAWMNYIAALGGHRPRPAKRAFAYCELGCGEGLTLVVLAASNPHARFVGVEPDSERVTRARRLAAACQARNVEFIEAGIGQALKRGLPQFDFVGAHGVWSWAGGKARGELLGFVRRKLKAGGLLCISYDALPGCAPILPVREIMTAYAERKGGDAGARAAHALAYVRYMAENRAGHFAHQPLVLRQVSELLEADPRHPLQDYLAGNWKPEYFGEVSRQLGEAGLSFAGSFPVAMNYMDLGVPERFRGFFETAPDRETFEVHRDFVQDTRFRIDCYVKARAAPGVRAADPWSKGLFNSVVFIPTTTPDALRTVMRVGELEIALQDRIVEPLRVALGRGPAAPVELSSIPGLAEFPVAELAKGLQYLVLAQCVVPGLRKCASSPGRAVSPANRALLEAAAASRAERVVLASGAFGGGIAFGTADALERAGARGVSPAGAPGRAVDARSAMFDWLGL